MTRKIAASCWWMHQLTFAHAIQIRARVFDLFPQTFAPDVFTYERYKWAYVILDSRSIWWDDQAHLVPLLDLINCRPRSPNAGPVFETEMDAANANAIAIASESSSTGDEVFEDYQQPNYVYFTYHGFVLPPAGALADSSNPNGGIHDDCVRVVITVPESDKQYQRKMSALYKRGIYTATNEFCLSPVRCSDPAVMPRVRTLLFVHFDYPIAAEQRAS